MTDRSADGTRFSTARYFATCRPDYYFTFASHDVIDIVAIFVGKGAICALKVMTLVQSNLNVIQQQQPITTW